MAERIIKTWHRQAKETDMAYRAFSLYLNQPPPRTLLYVRNAGYAPASVQKWKKENEWIQRAIDYDNARSDSIMEQDVSTINLYQQKVTEAGLEDMQILRGMWLKAAEQIQKEAVEGKENSEGELRPLTAAQLIGNITQLANARLNIDKLSRLAARMPDTHKAQIVAEDIDTFPDDVVELTLTGVVKMELPEPEIEDDLEDGEGHEAEDISE